MFPGKVDCVSAGVGEWQKQHSYCMLQLPFQGIKLDASLIRIQEPIHGDKGFVQAITELVHNMDMEVIAEGVETEEVRDRLSKQCVDRIQGYVYARPMKGEDVVEFHQQSL